jgi:hypothetical protein
MHFNQIVIRKEEKDRKRNIIYRNMKGRFLGSGGEIERQTYTDIQR